VVRQRSVSLTSTSSSLCHARLSPGSNMKASKTATELDVRHQRSEVRKDRRAPGRALLANAFGVARFDEIASDVKSTSRERTVLLTVVNVYLRLALTRKGYGGGQRFAVGRKLVVLGLCRLTFELIGEFKLVIIVALA
jgi:hypothetical protein